MNIRPVILAGSRDQGHPLKTCSTPGCGDRLPYGGVTMGSKWFCWECWKKKHTGKKR